jgi:hypothetical protein
MQMLVLQTKINSTGRRELGDSGKRWRNNIVE